MIKFNDRVSVGSTKKTKEGYLVATARVARTGVQEYLASELGDVAYQAGFDANDIVRVNRPESQVFAEDTLQSITRVPVTVNHPIDNVTADNWADLAVGEVGDSYARDGEWIVVNPMIKDASAIEAAKTTHKEISMGYTANIVLAKDKSIADFDMVDIKMNHLALVPRGRAGSKARIGDEWGAVPVLDNEKGSLPNNRKGGRMTDKTVVLGDNAVQVSAADAEVISQFKANTAKQLADAEASHKAAIEAKDGEIGALKAELADAKKAGNIDVDALVAARTDLIAKVKAVDSSIEVTGKSDAELRKAAVVSKYGDESVIDASDAAIEGMFKIATKDAQPSNPATQVFANGVANIADADAEMTKARLAYVDRLTRQNKGG